MRCLVLLGLTCGLLFEFGAPFSVLERVTVRHPTRTFDSCTSAPKFLFSSLDDESTSAPIETTSATKSSGQPSTEPEGTSYPIDVPSPILLSVSMILAIIGTGSVFDLMGGSPNLGFAPTAGIAAVVIPSCLFLFYASILKATAETEADDKEFMKGKY